MSGYQGGGSDKSGGHWHVIRIMSPRAPSSSMFSIGGPSMPGMLPSINSFTLTITNMAIMAGIEKGSL